MNQPAPHATLSLVIKTPDDTLDQLLVLQCQQGDEAALAELVCRWQPKLARHAYRLTENHEAISDIVQETWLAVVRGLRKLDDPACFRPWAYRIVTNKCADWIRRQQQLRKTQSSLANEAPSNEPSSDNSDEIALLQQELKLLPQEKRTILTMFYLEEMPINEIAQAMNIPEGTVKSRLFHARKLLQSKLERQHHE